MNPPVNGKIQGLFKAFECFSSTFQDKFSFQGLFKTVLYIQVLFKPVGTLSSTGDLWIVFMTSSEIFAATSADNLCKQTWIRPNKT